jgi:hypothetical protein
MPRKPRPQPTMDPEARKPASLASFRPDDETAAAILALIERGRTLQPQAEPPPEQSSGLWSLLGILGLLR